MAGNIIFNGSRYQTVKEYTPITDKNTKKTKIFLHDRKFFNKNELREDFVLHKVKLGELIDYIAYLYYKDELLWWFIADVNELEYAFDLFPGQILIIPNADKLIGIIN